MQQQQQHQNPQMGLPALGVGHWPRAWLATHLTIELVPAIGSVINVTRLPEAWAPGHPLFTYILQSHTIMHVLVAVGMFGNHALGLQRAGYVASQPQLLECAAGHAHTVWGLLTAPLGLLGVFSLGA